MVLRHGLGKLNTDSTTADLDMLFQDGRYQDASSLAASADTKAKILRTEAAGEGEKAIERDKSAKFQKELFEQKP